MLRINFEVTKTPTRLEQIDEIVVVNEGHAPWEDGTVTYQVHHLGRVRGRIRHTPGDGAVVLASKALELMVRLARDGLLPRNEPPPDPRRPERRDGTIPRNTNYAEGYEQEKH